MNNYEKPDAERYRVTPQSICIRGKPCCDVAPGGRLELGPASFKRPVQQGCIDVSELDLEIMSVPSGSPISNADAKAEIARFKSRLVAEGIQVPRVITNGIPTAGHTFIQAYDSYGDTVDDALQAGCQGCNAYGQGGYLVQEFYATSPVGRISFASHALGVYLGMVQFRIPHYKADTPYPPYNPICVNSNAWDAALEGVQNLV